MNRRLLFSVDIGPALNGTKRTEAQPQSKARYRGSDLENICTGGAKIGRYANHGVDRDEPRNNSHDFLLSICTALPEATARAHDHRQEAEPEIDRNDAAHLIQLLGSFGE